MCPARLFIIGGGELLSKEGTTQKDRASMGAYALGALPLLQFLVDFISIKEFIAKEVAFTDDFTVAGKLSSINDYWSQLTSIGPKYGSLIKILPYSKRISMTLFDNSNVNTTVEEKKRLVAIVGSDSYKREYANDLAKDWNSQVCMLSTVA